MDLASPVWFIRYFPICKRVKDDFVGVWSLTHLHCLGLKFWHLTNGWPWGKSQGSWCWGFCMVKVGRALAPHQLDRKRSNNELNQVLAYRKGFACFLWLRNNHTSMPLVSQSTVQTCQDIPVTCKRVYAHMNVYIHTHTCTPWKWDFNGRMDCPCVHMFWRHLAAQAASWFSAWCLDVSQRKKKTLFSLSSTDFQAVLSVSSWTWTTFRHN